MQEPEPEPCAEPVSPEPDCPDNSEPAGTDRPEDITGEDVPPEGFDKSKQPSVPEGAVTAPDQIEPDGVDSTAQVPAVDEPADQVTEIPQLEVQKPAETAPEPATPGTAPASDTWTPDIWVSAGADVDMEVELASSANAVPIARSGQW